MRKIYSAPNAMAVGNLRNLLVTEGVESEVRIPFLAAAGGDLPLTECWSELWIVHDEDVERAMRIIRAAPGPVGRAVESWKCPGCGEEIEGQFEACWRCGASRPEGES